MENPIKMDDLGGKPTIFGNTHIFRDSYGSGMGIVWGTVQGPIPENLTDVSVPESWFRGL